MENFFDFIDKRLFLRKSKHQLRSLSPINFPKEEFSLEKETRKFIDFSSNDYLGLANHPFLKEKSMEYLSKYGCGAKSSRFFSKNFSLYSNLEKKIAYLKGREDALILNTGYQANLSIINALTKKKSIVFADRLCHHSLLMGIKLSGARLIRYRHNDYDHLKKCMENNFSQGNTLIVTESVFGMDGDRADLDKIIETKKRFNAFLYVDEAHATGILGSKGSGLASNKKDIDLVMGTFGKALGSFGAYAACSKKLKQYLVNYCGGFIYSTALPPPILGAIDAALELLPQMEKERREIQENAKNLRKTLSQQGWNCGNSTTHIIPILMGRESNALKLKEELYRRGIFVAAIRPPTVPIKQSRIRLALSSSLPSELLGFFSKEMLEISKLGIDCGT